jgi:hypothetical protein
VVLLHVPDVLDVPHVPPPKCDFLINLDWIHSLIAHFQDLSKYNTLVMVRVLDLTKTRTTLVLMKNFRDSVTRYKNKVIYPQFLSVFNIWDYYYSLHNGLASRRRIFKKFYFLVDMGSFNIQTHKKRRFF